MINYKQTKGDSRYDPFLLISVVSLMAIGIIMVYSASSMIAMKQFGSHTYFFNRQIIHVLVAVLVLICCRYLPYSFYKVLTYPILIVAFILLLALYLPGVGHTAGGARRWLKIFNVSFQPSEFARLASDRTCCHKSRPLRPATAIPM